MAARMELSWGVLPLGWGSNPREMQSSFTLKVIDIDITLKGPIGTFYSITLCNGLNLLRVFLHRRLVHLIKDGSLRKGSILLLNKFQRVLTITIHKPDCETEITQAAVETNKFIISFGALCGILNEDVQNIFNPVVKVLSIFMGPDKNKRLLMTDAMVVQQGVLSPALSDLSSMLQEGDKIQLLEYFCLGVDQHKLIVIIKMNIIANNSQKLIYSEQPSSPYSPSSRGSCSVDATSDHYELQETVSRLEDEITDLKSEISELHRSHRLVMMGLGWNMN
ncbi:replication protein A 70 kDa DNA-binding subunit A [Canna indica]|uniref:Replication protein A 70 kDa DNA-binding subunit A n=1 Tax=Canna indica TaxID=4628 RepID=A0AAQ3QCF8_9LILI|nr:replication protein A 70 kDa DNA-binding subunit A [Canna indica]